LDVAPTVRQVKREGDHFGRALRNKTVDGQAFFGEIEEEPALGLAPADYDWSIGNHPLILSAVLEHLAFSKRLRAWGR
jgi:hypothetical protein